jgi:hypothetical protein
MHWIFLEEKNKIHLDFLNIKIRWLLWGTVIVIQKDFENCKLKLDSTQTKKGTEITSPICKKDLVLFPIIVLLLTLPDPKNVVCFKSDHKSNPKIMAQSKFFIN